jgi:hypothetical protein
MRGNFRFIRFLYKLIDIFYNFILIVSNYVLHEYTKRIIMMQTVTRLDVQHKFVHYFI